MSQLVVLFGNCSDPSHWILSIGQWATTARKNIFFDINVQSVEISKKLSKNLHNYEIEFMMCSEKDVF